MPFESFVYLMTSSNTCSNLSWEEWLFDHLQADQRAFLVYENMPSLVIGKNQNAWVEGDHTFLSQQNVGVVRRVSGGGTVVHGKGNVNYSFVVPRQSFSQTQNLSLLQRFFESLGLMTTQSERGDLLFEDRKFSGNAMAYRQRSVLHHGTLLFDLEQEFLFRCLKRPIASGWLRKNSSVKSNPMPTVNLGRHLKFASQVDFARDLAHWIASQWGVGVKEIDSSLQPTKTVAYAEKYSNWQWNFGHSPNFSFADPEPESHRTIIEVENGMMVRRINSDGSRLDFDPLPFVGFDDEDALRRLVN